MLEPPGDLDVPEHLPGPFWTGRIDDEQSGYNGVMVSVGLVDAAGS